jgi:hypothetical protein
MFPIESQGDPRWGVAVEGVVRGSVGRRCRTKARGCVPESSEWHRVRPPLPIRPHFRFACRFRLTETAGPWTAPSPGSTSRHIQQKSCQPFLTCGGSAGDGRLRPAGIAFRPGVPGPNPLLL